MIRGGKAMSKRGWRYSFFLFSADPADSGCFWAQNPDNTWVFRVVDVVEAESSHGWLSKWAQNGMKCSRKASRPPFVRCGIATLRFFQQSE